MPDDNKTNGGPTVADADRDWREEGNEKFKSPALREPQSSATVNDVTGELLPAVQNPDECAAMPYKGIAAEPFSKDAAAILMRPPREEDVEIRNFDGLVYLPGVFFRRRLNEAFGPGGWGIHPRKLIHESGFIFYQGALYVHGRFVAEAMGENRYNPTNDKMSYASAIEGAKTDCMTRCCKDLGVAAELWEPAFGRRWVATHAESYQGRNYKGQTVTLWRRKDASFTPPRDDTPDTHANGTASTPSTEQPAPPPAAPEPAAVEPQAPASGVIESLQDCADWWLKDHPETVFDPALHAGKVAYKCLTIEGRKEAAKNGKLYPVLFVTPSNRETHKWDTGSRVTWNEVCHEWMDVRAKGKVVKRKPVLIDTVRLAAPSPAPDDDFVPADDGAPAAEQELAFYQTEIAGFLRRGTETTKNMIHATIGDRQPFDVHDVSLLKTLFNRLSDPKAAKQ